MDNVNIPGMDQEDTSQDQMDRVSGVHEQQDPRKIVSKRMSTGPIHLMINLLYDKALFQFR
jgi:hypothetical protein